MRASQGSLITMLEYSVAEVISYRRHPKFGWSETRRAVVTNNKELLTSAPGQLALGYKQPNNKPSYNWYAKNLVCAWDIMWQDWRMIPCESVNVLSWFNLRTDEDLENFWAYFNLYLKNMTPQEKMGFMNK